MSIHYYISKCANFVAKEEKSDENEKEYIIVIFTFPQLVEIASFSLVDIDGIYELYWNKESTEIYILSYSFLEDSHETTFMHKINLDTHELILVKDFEKSIDAKLDPNFKKVCWTDSKTKSFYLLDIEKDLLY